MSKRAFTPQAELLWSQVPAGARNRILRNVFCRKCKVTELVDFSGSVKNGDLVLEGTCAKCGQRVVRVVESSGAPPPIN